MGAGALGADTDEEPEHGFGGLLRQLRAAAGLTQEELAERAELSLRAIRDLERGVTGRPRARSAGQLAGALGLTGPGRERFTQAAKTGQVAGADPPPEAEAPRQLPAAAPGFTGRSRELATLSGLLDLGAPPGTVVVSAIGGTAGVGKTALAVHWAHQVSDRFPDGQLYVNLRGYDPDQPMPPGEALAAFLRALGVPGPEIPGDTDERAARYRSLLAGRRILVLLDNAGSAEQVRPLLPASPACVTVVTSRDALPGLAAREGARRVELDLLPLADATRLLRGLIGPRAAADPAATAALARRCGRLPLALRVAAELAIARPGTSLAALVSELADEQRRLDLLHAGGDPRTALRAVFSWSYQHLSPAAARAFRLASLHPDGHLDQWSLAALTGSTADAADLVLGELTLAHLIQPAAPGYGPYDLLRAYARELSDGTDGDAAQRDALTRLFDYYLHTAIRAAAVNTADRRRLAALPATVSPGPPISTPGDALAWLDEQRATLVTVAAYTARHGWPRHTGQLAVTLFRYFDHGGHNAEAVDVFGHALRAAHASGDPAAEADALNGLAGFSMMTGRYQQAGEHYGRALALYTRLGDRSGEARIRSNLGLAALFQGRYPDADRHYQWAAARYRELGDRMGVAVVLDNLGIVEHHQGRYAESAAHHEESLAILRELGDRNALARNLPHLGLALLGLGQPERAARYCAEGLALSRANGRRPDIAGGLAYLGEVELRRGQASRAASHFAESLTLSRRSRDRLSEARALNGLGTALLATRGPAEAQRQHASALTLAGQIGLRYEVARAHHGLGHACLAAGDPDQARQHWRAALDLHTELGTPEAAAAADQLARLAGPPGGPAASP